MNEKQLTLELIPELELQPITLPDTKLDLVEQFSFALHNRDAIGLRQLIDKDDRHERWGNREGFIKKFVGFCNRMDKKHKGIYVHTVPGQCGRGYCNRGTRGLGVTVNTVRENKILWRFNLVFTETKLETLKLWLCQQFEVKHEEIPF